MDEIQAIDLVTLRGFTQAFWKLYRTGTYHNQREVYYTLEGIFFAQFGEYRFKSFDAFRMKRDRRNK